MVADSKNYLTQNESSTEHYNYYANNAMAMRPTNLMFHFDVDNAFTSSSRNCFVAIDSLQ